MRLTTEVAATLVIWKGGVDTAQKPLDTIYTGQSIGLSDPLLLPTATGGIAGFHPRSDIIYTLGCAG
jgi:hypothetical protein